MNPERTGIKITDHRKYGGFGENRKNGAMEGSVIPGRATI